MPSLSPTTSQSAPGAWTGGSRPMANGVQLPLEANSLSRCFSANHFDSAASPTGAAASAFSGSFSASSRSFTARAFSPL